MSSTAKAAAAKPNKKETERYRRDLLQKKSEISQEIVKTKDAGEENAEDATQDIADRATSAYTKEFLFSLGDNERLLLQQIDEALARIDQGAFGVCVHCGNVLAEKRLAAVPWTPYCVDCMELVEKGQLD
jgi:DnaK suppressor protein